MTDKTSVTFVTSFVDIYDAPFKNDSWRLTKFQQLAETGIQICIYINMSNVESLWNMTKNFSNIKIMKIITLEDSWIHQICQQYDDLKLPEKRNHQKDTKEYLTIMNSKVEFMYHAVIKNPFQSTHFVWLDFNLSHIFTNLKKSQEKLRFLSQASLAKSFLVFPGCWPHLTIDEKNNAIEPILKEIHWRFCGGFFMGDKESLIVFHELYKIHFPNFLFRFRTLVWEVNFWAWLEAATSYKSFKWSPNWYPGDHNDTILNIPTQFLSQSLKEQTTIINYPPYPNIFELNLPDTEIIPIATFTNPATYNTQNHRFVASSSSYLFLQGKHYLNTRYVNYTLCSAGYYYFHHPNKCIISHNIISELDENLVPLSYHIMKNPDLPSLALNEKEYFGLEDMRIYSLNGKTRFIASSINFSYVGKSRMVVGDYDISNLKLLNAHVIEPPEDTWCEKNWIPLIRKKRNEFEEEENEEEEWFIYKWSPMQIGRIINNQLVIEKTFPVISPIFDQFRGSTTFVEYQDCLVGVVHFSENNSPRQYFHCLVMLDKHTFQPLKYSNIFYFDKIGIEFCIGFTIRSSLEEPSQNTFCFWISQFDASPCLLKINSDNLPFVFLVK